MLVECGFVRVTASDGREFTFSPSLGRIAALADPRGIISLYGRLFGDGAVKAAHEVLAGLADQDDITPLIGEPVATKTGVEFVGGIMPERERVIIARHLMQHGIAGRSRPGAGAEGKFSDRFDASEYVSAARVHLGLSSADAEALSMTEFQQMLDMKFPQMKAAELPTEDEYFAAMEAADAFIARVNARAAAQGPTNG